MQNIRIVTLCSIDSHNLYGTFGAGYKYFT